MMRTEIVDPRTVARELPGLFEIVFPGLTPGLVAHLNGSRSALPDAPVSDDLIRSSVMSPALLFEVACVRADRLVEGNEAADDAGSCLAEAWLQQSRFYDARRVETIGDQDWSTACLVGDSLYRSLLIAEGTMGGPLVVRPSVPGCQWIGNSWGDYAVGDCLVEVKCVSGNFGGADYRQVLIYWMLSLVAEIEGHGSAWKEAVLINPRRGLMVDLHLPDLLAIVGRGATHVEMMQRFLSVVGERSPR